MSQQPITVTLPDELYERLQQIAEDSDRSLETVVLESLDLLFSQSGTDTIALDALKGYTDDQLWAVVHRRMSWPESTRLRELSQIGKSVPLTRDEQVELDGLLEQVDRDVLLRSEALLLLKTRGHSVERYFTPAP